MHTPGPWIVEVEAAEVNCYGGMGVTRVKALNAPLFYKTICADTQYYPVAPNPEDMRLIAAAPDLLEACKALLVMMDRGPKPDKLDAALTWRQNDELARSMADAAIAKAEGK